MDDGRPERTKLESAPTASAAATRGDAAGRAERAGVLLTLGIVLEDALGVTCGDCVEVCVTDTVLVPVGVGVPVEEDVGVIASTAVTDTTVTNEDGALEVMPAATSAPATTGLAQSAAAKVVEASVDVRAVDRAVADSQGEVERVPV